MPIDDPLIYLCLLTFDVFIDEAHFEAEEPHDTYQRWIWMPFPPMEDMDLQFTEPEEFMTEVDGIAWMVDEGYCLVHCTDSIADGTDGDTPQTVHARSIAQGWTRVDPGTLLDKPS